MMAGKVRHLLEREGRFYARLAVPKELRALVGKRELLEPLGADRRAAQRRLPAAVAVFQARLEAARRGASLNQPEEALLPPVQAARRRYEASIAFDADLRRRTPWYARLGSLDERQIADLKAIASGAASADEAKPVLESINSGLLKDAQETAMQRERAMLLASAELAAINVILHRDDGEPDPAPPPFLKAPEEAQQGHQAQSVSGSIRAVFDGYRAELHTIGKGRDAEKRWAPVIISLLNFLGHDRIEKLDRRDAIRWKDHLLETLAPKTVRDTYISTARAAFVWAEANERAHQNPFAGVRVRLAKKVLTREKGYTDSEAVAVLQASRAYRGSARELLQTTAAKRWTPLLAAYTGARIGELCQLRREDVLNAEGIPYIRVTPEAGTVKSGLFRDVPLHSHIIDEGFLEFVASQKAGPLFFIQGRRTGKTPPASIVAGRMANWVRALKVADERVQPNHGWRHRLKTVGRELRFDTRVLDAIQGHAPRTAGEDYGDVTLRAKHELIKLLPRYPIEVN